MFDRGTLNDAVRSEGGISRRLLLGYAGALAALPVLGLRAEGRTLRKPKFDSDPFTAGVASGDPTDTGVVLWTRLAPRPLEPGGGMPAEKVSVTWELADDEGMTKIVRKGEALATPQLGHSVHVEVDGLTPGRWYYYRFQAGDSASVVGRTRTAPEAESTPDSLKFAFASCQHYEAGFFTAYEHMLKDQLDLVVHLGDYIYEGPGRDNGVRKHQGAEIESLDDYRTRYAQYRSDKHLAAMHAACPWVVTWDDHEVDNNYADEINEKEGVDPIDFLLRRANAYQAYYEMMPLRRECLPQGPNLQLYRTVKFGRLAEFQVLDTRQYRTDQPNGDKRSPLNDAAMDRKNSLLGARQADWLASRLLASGGTWNVLAQQVMMGMVGFPSPGEPQYSMDQWPGAAAERIRLMKFLADRKVPNPVVLTGDIHCNWANDLRVDDRKQDEPVVAAEFVGTSISSGGDGSDTRKGSDLMLAANPGIRFFNAQRGYVRCNVTPTEWRTDYQVLDQVTKPGGVATTRASFRLEAGKPGLNSA
jgi:alkaline phosphatase D